MTQEIEQTVSLILSAFDNRNLSSALNICRSEHRLDQLFKKEFDRIMVELSEIDFKSIWRSRSGCRISMIAQKAMFLMKKVMIDIWELTITQKPAPVTFIQQLIARMQDS